MASGSGYKTQKPKVTAELKAQVPPRASYKPPEPVKGEEECEEKEATPSRLRSLFESAFSKSLQNRALQVVQPPEVASMSWKGLQDTSVDAVNTVKPVPTIIVEADPPHPLARHRVWLNPLVLSLVLVVIGAGVLVSAAIMQRPGEPGYVNFFGGQVYSVQVGGSLAGSWQSDTPLAPKVPLQTGPYSVLGKPTLTVAFINEVLAAYNSPASGKGQALYDLGVQYGIDPTFALAFFFHESDFGTQGEARVSLSLGNLRCIPNFKCQDGYAWFPSWEAGFKAWYSLIRNLYVADWGLTTVDQIIPRYAPPSDNNDDSAYIASLKLAINTWHAGIVRV
jgi:hypothetical protein